MSGGTTDNRDASVQKFWLEIGAVLCAVGVAAGAFGAHGLRDSIEPRLLQAYEKGVFYHLIHALAIVSISGISFVAEQVKRRVLNTFFFGIVVFSGSLYLMAITGQRWLGAITPIGGLAFIIAWTVLALSVHNRANSNNEPA